MAETMIAQLSTFRDFTCFLGEFMCSNSSTHAFLCVKSFFTSIHGILWTNLVFRHVLTMVLPPTLKYQIKQGLPHIVKGYIRVSYAWQTAMLTTVDILGWQKHTPTFCANVLVEGVNVTTRHATNWITWPKNRNPYIWKMSAEWEM